MKKSERFNSHLTANNVRSGWKRKALLAQNFKKWLINESSLTAQLQKRYADFSVLPVAVALSTAFNDENKVLNIRQRQLVFMREVLLLGHKAPVVFAHSVMPIKSLRGLWAGFTKLGQKPLGATLFANPKIKRTPLSYQKLRPQHTLFKRTQHHLKSHGYLEMPKMLWARRSIFSLNHAGALQIMVTEVFLPTLIKKVDN